MIRAVIRAMIRAVLSSVMPPGCKTPWSSAPAGQEAVGGTQRVLVCASPWHHNEGTSGAEPAKNWDAVIGESTEAINRAAGECCATVVHPATWGTQKQWQMFYELSKLGNCWMPGCQK